MTTVGKKRKKTARSSEQKSRVRVSKVNTTLFRTFVEGTDDLVTRVDSDGVFLYVNRTAEKIFGLPINEIVGKCYYDFIHPDDRDDARITFGKWINKKIPSVTFENRQMSFTGEIRYLLWTVNLYYDKKGKLTGANSIARDITDRKKSEKALLNQTRLILSILDNMAEGVAVIDEMGQLVLFNRKAELMLGKGLTPRPSKAWSEHYGLFLPDQITPYPSKDLPLMRALSGEEVDACELYVKHEKMPDGIFIRVSARPLMTSRGEKRGAVAVFHDFTEEKMAETEIRTSAERFRSLFEATFEVILIHDKGILLDFNNTAITTFGYSEEELRGMSVLSLITSEARDHVAKILAALSKDFHAVIEPFETIGLRKDGTTFIAEVRGKSGTYQGKPARIVAVRDVTDRKHAEDSLRESEERFRNLLNATYEGIVILDKDIILDANHRAAEEVGCPYSQFVGRSVLDFVDAESRDMVLQNIDQTSDEPDIDIGPYELTVRRPDDSLFYAEVRGKGLIYRERRVRVIVFRNITERKQAEQKLREREHLLQNQNRVFVRLAKSNMWVRGDLSATLNEITETTAKTLEIYSAAVWFFNNEMSTLCCQNFYDAHAHQHSGGMTLKDEEYPAFQAAIEEDRIIAIDDVKQDPRTKKFAATYLSLHNITSMINIPIRLQGKVAGMMVCAHRGPARSWTFEEQNFAGSMADLVALALEESERRKAEKELEYRLAFENLLATVSTNFINLPQDNIDAGIHDALRKIGEFARVDRSYIYLISPNGKTVSNTHEWCAEGIEQQKSNLQNIPVNTIQWWMEQLKTTEKIYIPRVADLPDELSNFREMLEAQAIQSLIGIPMVYEKALIGFFGFDSVREEKQWSADSIALLKIVGEMFTNAFEHQWKKEALQKAKDDLEVKVGERTRALREKQGQLVQSEKMAAMGHLVAGVAHEINTPLGAIKSNNDIFLRSFGKLQRLLSDSVVSKNTASHQDINRIIESINQLNEINKTATGRIAKIVSSLRTFARLDKAEQDTVDIHEGIESTLTLVHHEIKNRIEVHKEYGDLSPVTCFPNQLNQVFMNILINSSQAIVDKGDIFITTTKRDDTVIIEFRDTGKGIAKENLQRIFDPGFTTKGVGVGTGLGLSIVYQIIKDHSGLIEVESDLGRGTTFRIILPV